MKEQENHLIVRGIILMSNPFVILGVIGLMLLAGWLTTGEVTPLLCIVAGVYLVLSILGGLLAKPKRKPAKSCTENVSTNHKEGIAE